MLDGLFKPRGVAVVGASANPYSIGHIVIKNLSAYGYKGPIFPINPKGGHIRSFKAFKSVLDVPDVIDLVNISVKHSLVPAVLEECGKKGVKFAIVHTAGFKEVGEEGIKREREMVELAHSYGMRLFGPNSQGIQNADPEISVYANFTFVPMKPGNISIIAQGGGMGEMLKLHLHNVGLGHRMYCSYGNECDLTMPEILDYYGQDEGTRVIMMQTESFKDPAAFLEVASRITPKIPILAIKAGRTREGSVAVSSHTGTLVDQARMASAMYQKAGVVEFHDTDEMIKAAIAFSTQEPPRGRRIGMITNTGGPASRRSTRRWTTGSSSPPGRRKAGRSSKRACTPRPASATRSTWSPPPTRITSTPRSRPSSPRRAPTWCWCSSSPPPSPTPRPSRAASRRPPTPPTSRWSWWSRPTRSSTA